MFTTLHTASALLTRRTLRPQWASLAGLCLASVLPLHDLTPATAYSRVATDPLEQMACRALIGIEVAVPLELILAKPRARFGCTPVVGLPGSVEGHVLRRALGQVNPCHICTID
jgi:hypothetical protein